MSISANHENVFENGRGDSNRLWHTQANHSFCLGCQDCFYRHSCGGLEIPAPLFDCSDFCKCTDRSTCDNVCPSRPEHFAARIQEVRGFGLENVPPAPSLGTPRLPRSVPVLYHFSRRDRIIQCDAAALPLAKLIDFSRGSARLANREQLLQAFKLPDNCRVIATATDRDLNLERWWQLRDRTSVVRSLRDVGVSLITSPNFSLFDDVPRTDNLYNMKRIALTWSEIQNEDMPCALHLNARTDRDWERWTEFLLQRREIGAVSFEFGTGAGFPQRIGWYVNQLVVLGNRIRRPLHLLIRGGVHVIDRLLPVFPNLTLIDTRPFMKTTRRQRAEVAEGRLRWKNCPTSPGESLDALLEENIATVSATVPGVAKMFHDADLLRECSLSDAANDANDESL